MESRHVTYLVATGTRTEALVLEVELLDAERTRLLLIVVDELILQRARHDSCEGEQRKERSRSATRAESGVAAEVVVGEEEVTARRRGVREGASVVVCGEMEVGAFVWCGCVGV